MDGRLLEQRRRELSMPVSVLAARSGVPPSTVKRILARGLPKAAFGSVDAVARALGMNVGLTATSESLAFQEQQARAKAERMVSMVQGSSALESQAVGETDRETMVLRTVHELVAGPKRRLWAM